MGLFLSVMAFFLSHPAHAGYDCVKKINEDGSETRVCTQNSEPNPYAPSPELSQQWKKTEAEKEAKKIEDAKADGTWNSPAQLENERAGTPSSGRTDTSAEAIERKARALKAEYKKQTAAKPQALKPLANKPKYFTGTTATFASPTSNRVVEARTSKYYEDIGKRIYVKCGKPEQTEKYKSCFERVKRDTNWE